MIIALSILMLIAGLVIIAKSADWFVDASVTIAKSLRIPPMIIGATIVSIGTTLPELITSMTSIIIGTTKGNPADYNALAIGNSIGSMACNLGLILAISLIVRSSMSDKSFNIKGIFLLMVSGLLAIFVATNTSLEMYEGIILLVLFAVFIAINIIQAIKHRRKCDVLIADLTPTALLPDKGKLDCTLVGNNATLDSRSCATTSLAIPTGYNDSSYCRRSRASTLLLAIKFILGGGGIAIGAYLMVNNATLLCDLAGVPTQIVGATIVAIGTSLPELATAISAIAKGEAALSYGNLIGANVINATLLLGSITLMSGSLAVEPFTASYGIIFMLAIAAVAIIPTIMRGKTSRMQGISLLVLYIGMIVANILYIAL